MKDFQLSPHVTFFDLTKTQHVEFQEENRKCTTEDIQKLAECANQLEVVQIILGCDLDKHSGRRCPALNKAVGGSPNSEHMKNTATDFSPKGPDTLETVNAAFEKIVAAAKAGKIKFGQMIVESQDKGREGRVFWLHISLPAPHRDPARCGECFRIVIAQDGAKKTEFVTRIA